MQELEDRVRQMESLLTASGFDASGLSSLQQTESQASDAMSSNPDVGSDPCGFVDAGLVQTYGDTVAQRTPLTSNPPSCAASCENTPLDPHTDAVSMWPTFEADPFTQGWNLPEDFHQHTWVEPGPTKRGLPPPHEAILLLQEYLEDWNKAIPLFEKNTLNQIFQDCYAGSEPDDSNAWLAVAAVLGLAHRLRGMSPVASPDDESLAEGYKEKLLEAVPRLLMQDPTLLSVQCLIALGMLLYLSIDNDRAPFFISTALQMMEPLGLGSRTRPSGTVIEDQWLLAFWIAFSLDTEMCLRYGRMPSRRVADLTLLELPHSPPAEGVGELRSSAGDWSVNFLRLKAELALIQARVCEDLLSTSAQSKDVAETGEKLKQSLAEWRTLWIFRMPPENLMREVHRSDIVLLANLEASYHTTLYSLHTHMTLQHRRTAGIFDPDTVLKVGLEPSQPCLADTRRFVAFMHFLPRGDVAAIYMTSHAMVASIAVLMAHAVANPEDSDAPADLRVSRAMLDVLIHLSGKCGRAECRVVREVCQLLYQQAESVVPKR